MPRLLTHELSNPLYLSLEVALVCFLVHAYMKKGSMEVKALLVGAIMGVYEMYLQQNVTPKGVENVSQ